MMGMRETEFSLYVLFLPNETMRYLAKKLCPEYSDTDYTEDPASFHEEVIEALDGKVECINRLSGYAYRHPANGDDSVLRQSFDDEPVYYIPLEKGPTLFRPAYETLDEVISEIVGKIGDVLPLDFDYALNVCSLEGTNFE